MTIEIKKTADTGIIELGGRLNTTTAPDLDRAINVDLAGVSNLILDMKALTHISSAGLRVLLSTQKRLQKKGSLKLRNVCENVMEIFEIAGFVNILEIE